MTRDEFDAFCTTLPSTFMVVQWKGAHVWKVGRDEEGWAKRAKVFAIGADRGGFRFSFKPSPMLGQVLSGDERLSPAPHLGRAGWLSAKGRDLDADDARLWLAVSHETVATGMTKRDRLALGLASS